MKPFPLLSYICHRFLLDFQCYTGYVIFVFDKDPCTIELDTAYVQKTGDFVHFVAGGKFELMEEIHLSYMEKVLVRDFVEHVMNGTAESNRYKGLLFLWLSG